MSCHPGHSVKALLMNAALGAGSELIIDVAQGVDWTGALAVVYGIQQVNPAAARIAMPYIAMPCMGRHRMSQWTAL